MTDTTQSLFFSADLQEAAAQSLVQESLRDMDDGELFLEYNQSESLAYDDGRLKHASFNTSQGFGLRSVLGEMTAYAHASVLSMTALRQAAETVRAIRKGYEGDVALTPSPLVTPHQLYSTDNPIGSVGFAEKISLLEKIDRYLRRKDNRVRQVSASIYNEWQAVRILRPDGVSIQDIRPLVRLNVSVVVEQNGRMERGSSGAGGRFNFTRYMDGPAWEEEANEALRQALVNLEALPAPAGEMIVVLGNGWPGVLLHEAVGHGLEGDFNRKKTSVFSGMIGQRVAAPGVTVVDDGTLESRRGSLHVDDEGTPTQHTVLIEDGILVGYLQDRMNARLMGVSPTGNGRRESYSCQPMPRMTNTYMLGGQQDPAEIIAGVKKGLYAPHFGGGQVDITSGKFVFSASEAYLIENGKLGAPVKGATLIGNGPDVLTRVTAIGNDMSLDKGVGTCGKAGQSVPVGVGQPSMRIDGMTVGGTAV